MTDTYEQPRNGSETDPESERIAVEIEQTRSDMAGTIDEIGHRLQPQNLANEAREKVRDATVGKVERFMEDAGQGVQKTGNGMIDTVRQNPVPAALAAIGIGWLALRMRDQSSPSYGNGYRYGSGSGYRSDGNGSGRRYTSPYRDFGGRDYSGGDYTAGNQDAMDRARQGAQDVADQAAQRAEQIGTDAQRAAQDAFDTTQQRLQSAQWQVDRTWNENPLALGALAVGVGAAVALAIPETQKERELLGEQRDRLVEKVSSAATDALDQAQVKAQELSDQVVGAGGDAEGGNTQASSEPVYSASPSDQS